jgi:tetratricopeptide (TPR) repeat protein
VRALVLVLAILCAAPALAVAAEASYADGNAAYKGGRYEEAIADYEALVEAGVVHQNLYYNLANAYFRAGFLGPAVYNYERALRIDPGFADARYNLRVAREAVAEKVVDRLEEAETEPLYTRVVTFFSIGELSVGFLLLNALFFGALVALRILADGFARTALKVVSAFVGVGYLACAALLAGHILFLETVQVGVVLPDELLMHEGADGASAERGQVHAGLRVRVIGEEPGWLRVRLANGHEGWVPSDAIGRL